MILYFFFFYLYVFDVSNKINVRESIKELFFFFFWLRIKFLFFLNTKDQLLFIKYKYNDYHQWRSQEFRLGGARLKDKIGNKKLININNKISKELYDNLIVIQNLT